MASLRNRAHWSDAQLLAELATLTLMHARSHLPPGRRRRQALTRLRPGATMLVLAVAPAATLATAAASGGYATHGPNVTGRSA